MKFFTAKFLSLALLVCALTGSIEASRCADNGCEQQERGCCFSSCYECGCNPLYCGAWDLQVQGGVAPIIWRNRSDFLAVSTAGAITVAATGPKFSTLFKTPWNVGGQVGYHLSDNTRLYVEFNYTQANAKSAIALAGFVAPVTSFVINPAKYKLFDAFVGARYYWDRWCDRVAFFLGGKVGLTHHKANTFSSVVINGTTITNAPAYLRNTVVTGGADFGLDFCFCGNWSFVITGSVLASCGPRPTTYLTPTAPIGTFAQLILGHIGTELRFPVTAGIRYSF